MVRRARRAARRTSPGARSVGVVFRVSRMVMRPPLASTKRARQRGDAGEMLQEVQRRPFGRSSARAPARHLGDLRRRARIPRRRWRRSFERGSPGRAGGTLPAQRPARRACRRTSPETRRAPRARRAPRRVGRDVAGTDVFLERATNEIPIERRLERRRGRRRPHAVVPCGPPARRAGPRGLERLGRLGDGRRAKAPDALTSDHTASSRSRLRCRRLDGRAR